MTIYLRQCHCEPNLAGPRIDLSETKAVLHRMACVKCGKPWIDTDDLKKMLMDEMDAQASETARRSLGG